MSAFCGREQGTAVHRRVLLWPRFTFWSNTRSHSVPSDRWSSRESVSTAERSSEEHPRSPSVGRPARLTIFCSEFFFPGQQEESVRCDDCTRGSPAPVCPLRGFLQLNLLRLTDQRQQRVLQHQPHRLAPPDAARLSSLARRIRRSPGYCLRILKPFR